MFTFDVDAAIGKGNAHVANLANSANPTTEKPQISKISNISNPAPSFSAELRAELLALVDAVAAFHGFTLEQTAEAQQIAEANPVAALECFRELVQHTRKPTGPKPRDDVDHTVLDHDVEARRQKVLAMLAEHPDKQYALITDTEADPEAVILTLAIRGQEPFELLIPRDRYDPFLLLDLIERHGATVH